MTWRCRVACRRRSAPAAGFTLLELLVVLAILGAMLVLLVGYRPPWSRGLEISATAAELAGQLRLVRSEAIAANRPVAFEIDLSGHRYRAGAAPPKVLPADMTLSMLTIVGERQSAGVGNIRFNPDGSSTGGRIVLANRARRIAVGVDWLSGRVTVADVR
jgi:general secretion pathway protein H